MGGLVAGLGLVRLTRAHPSLLPSQHLQQRESGVEGESCYYHCVLCRYSTKAKLNLIQHVRSMKHQRSESLRKLQRLQKGLPEEDEDLGQIFTIRRCPSTDPGEWSRGPQVAAVLLAWGTRRDCHFPLNY